MSIITHCMDGDMIWGKSVDSVTDAFDAFSLYNECGMSWMFMPPPANLYTESLASKVLSLGGEAFGKWWGHESGAPMNASRAP